MHAACCGPNAWVAVQGSTGVFVNNLPVVRVGDMTQHCGGLGAMITGSATVTVGEAGVSATAPPDVRDRVQNAIEAAETGLGIAGDGLGGLGEAASHRASNFGRLLRTSDDPAVRSNAARMLRPTAVGARRFSTVSKALGPAGTALDFGTNIAEGHSVEESGGRTAIDFGAATAGAETGAAAGLACGPAAEICSPAGAIIGGVAGGIAGGKIGDFLFGD
jgi:hypothetical protein